MRLVAVLSIGVAGTVVLAASASSAEDAGAPAAPRAPAAPAQGHVVPPDLDDVEHMCALLTGCDRLPLPAGVVPRDFAACVRTMRDELSSPGAAFASLTLRECGLEASSCGALRTCALRGARTDVCAGRGKSGPVDHCDGEGRAITCEGERVTLVRDCPRGGEQCVVVGGKASCSLGPCETDSAPACSRSGTRVLECKKGKLLSLDCAAFGMRCVSSGEGGPRCATSAPACGTGASRCEADDVAVGCFHGHEVRIDCKAAGLACASRSTPAGSLVGACAEPAPPAKGACDPDAKPRCDGAKLRWCAWGKPRSYLCKSVGLSRCVTDDKGSRCAG